MIKEEIEKVSITAQDLLNDLKNRLTWLKKNDVGFGSIQEKYNAPEAQLESIRKHPLLKDAKTSAKIFVIIDDSKSFIDVDFVKESVAPVQEPVEVLISQVATNHATAEEQSSADSFAAL